MLQTRETERTEAAALLERRMAAMEAVLAARRKVLTEPAKPEAARGPGADLRFGVTHSAGAASPPRATPCPAMSQHERPGCPCL